MIYRLLEVWRATPISRIWETKFSGRNGEGCIRLKAKGLLLFPRGKKIRMGPVLRRRGKCRLDGSRSIDPCQPRFRDKTIFSVFQELHSRQRITSCIYDRPPSLPPPPHGISRKGSSSREILGTLAGDLITIAY